MNESKARTRYPEAYRDPGAALTFREHASEYPWEALTESDIEKREFECPCKLSIHLECPGSCRFCSRKCSPQRAANLIAVASLPALEKRLAQMRPHAATEIRKVHKHPTNVAASPPYAEEVL